MKTRTKFTSAIVIVSGLLVAFASETSARNTQEVSMKEARALVLASLDSGTRRLPGLHIDGEGVRDSAYPAFYTFAVMWDGTPGGSVMVGFFDVDPRTADVFEGTGCGERKSRSLEKLQRQIRRRIGVTESDYRRLKRKGPYCE